MEFETDTFRVKRAEKVIVRVERIDGKLRARLIRPQVNRHDKGTTTTSHDQIIGLHGIAVLYLIGADGKLVCVEAGPTSIEETVIGSLGERFEDVEGLAMTEGGTLYAAVYRAND